MAAATTVEARSRNSAGDASFAIYLTHSAAISVLVPRLHKLGEAVPPAVPFFGVVAIATARGMIAHLLVERPLLRGLHGASTRVPTSRAFA